jgi:hypothetical protein
MIAQADYGISKVHYNDDHNHIERVWVHKISQDKIAKNRIIVGPGRTVTKKKVLDRMESGKKFKTLLKKNGKWVTGQWVNKYTYTGIFLRSDRTPDAEPKPEDDLEDLPKF